MNILIVRLRSIGDVVFTTPAIRALRRRFPTAHLTYIVEPAAAPLVAGNPHLDDVIVAPRRGGVRQIVNDLALARRLRHRQFDLAIDFHGGPRSSLLTFLSGARRRIGYTIAGRSWMYTDRIARTRELRPRHSVENQWDLLRPLGIAPPEPSRDPVEMVRDASAAARIEARLARAGLGPDDELVVIHVSAGNPFRRWPLPHFAVVAAALADEGYSVLVTSGPSELDAAARVMEDARRLSSDGACRRILDIGEVPLDELRAVLDRAALYIGGDSGPLHVAATTRVPVVGLYGPTLPVRSGPWRSPDAVHEAVEVEGLACRPCDQRACAPGDFRCLTTISAEHVLAAARRALVRGRSGREEH